jgi:prohibitin 2
MQEKKSTIIRAKGEAKSAELIGDAIQNNPAFLELRRIEAARDISQTVARGGNRLFLSADALLMNLMNGEGESDGSGAKAWL